MLSSGNLGHYPYIRIQRIANGNPFVSAVMSSTGDLIDPLALSFLTQTRYLWNDDL
jgi:hypothetical protein